MKKLLFLLLFLPIFCFCQYDDFKPNDTDLLVLNNFEIKDHVIFWQKVYEGTPNITNPKFKNSIAENCLLPKCKSCSLFMTEEFKFEYKIETKENKYRVTAYNFRFKNSLQYSLWNVTTDAKENSLEFFMLKNKNGELRKNDTAKTNLISLHYFLDSNFSPKTLLNQDDW